MVTPDISSFNYYDYLHLFMIHAYPRTFINSATYGGILFWCSLGYFLFGFMFRNLVQHCLLLSFLKCVLFLLFNYLSSMQLIFILFLRFVFLIPSHPAFIFLKNLISDEGMLCCHTINKHKIENKRILKHPFVLLVTHICLPIQYFGLL
jgi:hypothetical protein